MSDPARPVYVSGVDFRERVQRVQVASNLVCVAAGPGLFFLTITNPATPAVLGKCEGAEYVRSFQLRDRYLYSLHELSLEVFDISNPAQPARVGTATGGFEGGSGIQVKDGYGYIAATTGLHVFDISNPNVPALLTTCTKFSTNALAVDVTGNYAYLSTSEGLRVFILTNSAQPSLVWENTLGSGARCVLATSRYCYLAVDNSLQVLDLTRPDQPTSLGSYVASGETFDVALMDTHALLAAGNEGMQVLDLNNPAQPTLLGTHETGGPSEALQVVGRYVYLVDGNSGVEVIDLASTNGLERVGRFKTANYARTIYVAGTNAFVGTEAGLEVVNVSDPLRPVRVGGLESARVRDMQVVGNLAFVAADRLLIVDISNPAAPTSITNWDGIDQVRGLQVVGQFAYLAAGWALSIINVENPSQPKLIGTCATVAPVQNLQIIGGIAYVIVSEALELYAERFDYSHPQSWLQIFDVSNAAQPKLLGQCSISEDGHAIKVVGQYAFVAGGSWREDAPSWRDALEVIDVSDPTNPIRLGGFSAPGWAGDIQVIGDYIYLADGPAGLAIFDLPAGTLGTGGPLAVSIEAPWTNVAAGYQLNLTGYIDGFATASAWNFGDGTLSSNRLAVSHSWAAPGDYTVELRAFNDTYPAGIPGILMVHIGEGKHYVAAGNQTPAWPYTSWATAATNIQDAVDAAQAQGSTVLVSNGVYSTGGRQAFSSRLLNRVLVDKPVTVRSVNGPQFTRIEGYQVPGTSNGITAIRCVYLSEGASLDGFTLAKGATRSDGNWDNDRCGGGLLCESTTDVVSNCVLVGNSADYEGGGAFGGTLTSCALSNNVAGYGGGACGTDMNNCWLAGNSAAEGGGAAGGTQNNCLFVANHSTGTGGGGAMGGTLNNCTLVGNSAEGGYGGGGVYGAMLNNCILFYNTAPQNANYSTSEGWTITLSNCCTTPFPSGTNYNASGTITTPPRFVDYAHGNLRLETNSPCINSGNNTYVPGALDLDGNPRIVSGTVDIGAYEYQGAGSRISYAWLQQYGLSTDSSTDNLDADGDGHSNWQEWVCGTCPTNRSSVLRMLSAAPVGGSVAVVWQSVAGMNYFVECSTNLSTLPSFRCIATNIPGYTTMTGYWDTNPPRIGPNFYRVGVAR